MRKATIFAMALMAGVTITGNTLKVQAASANACLPKQTIVVGKSELKDCLNNGQELLKDCLEQLKDSQIGNCTVLTIPCLPGNGDGQPELNKPGNGTTETPDDNTPDGSTPENGTPDDGDAETDYHAYVLRVAELVNEERAKAGLNPLTLQENITEAAQVRAMETVTSFSHTRPDGRHFSTALSEAGVTYRGAGENIAWGQKTPEQVMEGWMNSAGHRVNILNENYTSIGIGYYQNSAGVNYWSQLFTY